MATIDQLSCVSIDLITNPMTSLNGSYMQLGSPLPQVNYVALSPMPSTINEDELYLVVDLVISSVGLLEPDLLTLSRPSMCVPSREVFFHPVNISWKP
jgi:hypothetical protein